ncbi:MAG TPA: YdcF family protein [Firmicutes bacterium]|nr:YdcF family protein [Bacillota bacterium]
MKKVWCWFDGIAGSIVCILGILLVVVPIDIRWMGFLALMFGMLYIFSVFQRKKVPAWKKANQIFRGLFIAGAVFILAFLGMMRLSTREYQETSEPRTVIVLGCKVRGEEPSMMLQNRLDAALMFLQEHEEYACIVSGGQGEGEAISEAEAMYRFLTENGIAAERIILEDQSVNTRQNLEYSAQKIREAGLPEDVVIVTDGFHQYRAQMYAQWAGLSAEGVDCYLRLDSAICYWLREIPGVIIAWLEQLF